MREFFKYEGLGNDFVVIAGPVDVDAAVSLCDRRRGVGGDGVAAVLAARDGAVARMQVTNADGSIPEMCGNALRCVGLHLVNTGAAQPGEPFVVDTDAGPKEVVVHGEGDLADVVVDMGAGRLDSPRQFPPLRRAPVDLAGGGSALGTAVSMGNPHLVLEASPDRVLAARAGPPLELDPRFPERINVEFAALADDGAIDVVVWERGVGLTEACGTGACAVAVAFVEAGLAPRGREVVVRLPGGALTIVVPTDRAAGVLMRGPARRVFAGTVDVDALRRVPG